MGKAGKRAKRLHFDGSIKLEFRGAKVTTDGGLLVVRELDEALGLTDMATCMLSEGRAKNRRHDLTGLLRQSIYARLAGYEDVNDQEALFRDSAMLAVIGRKALERNAASSATISRFETEILAAEDNLEALALINGAWVARAMEEIEAKKVILDMDSSESPVHGRQEGSAHNGHFLSRCYHPLFCFNQHGDCEGASLRPGNVHSADGWLGLLEPIVDRCRGSGRKLYFRTDAAFASPDMYKYLEGQGILYAIRLKSNRRLEEYIEHLLTRPVGRPSKKPRVFYHDFYYRAASWKKSRRVVSKVEWHQGELFPRVGFVVTNLSRSSKNAFRFYNQRGNCERFIKEGKYAIAWTRLFCSRFIPNRVRMALFILAYNLGNFLRRFALPREVSSWSLRSIQLKLVKIGAKVVTHARRTIFQLAEVAVSEALFVKIIDRIHRLRYAPEICAHLNPCLTRPAIGMSMHAAVEACPNMEECMLLAVSSAKTEVVIWPRRPIRPRSPC